MVTKMEGGTTTLSSNSVTLVPTATTTTTSTTPTTTPTAAAVAAARLLGASAEAGPGQTPRETHSIHCKNTAIRTQQSETIITHT